MITYEELEDGSILSRDGSIQTGYIKGRILARMNDEGETVEYEPYQELIDSGADIKWITSEEKSAHELQQVKDAVNQEAKAYLASTDWYVMRKFDSGEPMPEDVRDARAEARAKVS